MNSFVTAIRQLTPELVPLLQRRYVVLKAIGRMGPVGRRSVAQTLGLSERVLRGEVNNLKTQELLDVSSEGMRMTEKGRQTLLELDELMRDLLNLTELQHALMDEYALEKVFIVPGNSDESPWVKRELGRVTVECMKQLRTGKNIIAVTGGTTMATVADMLTPDFGTDALFVPARGGIGEEIYNQANTICAKMAEKTQAEYKALYVPDQVSQDAYEKFVQEPSIREVLEYISAADFVLHGIGDAMTMAKRRKTSEEDVKKIQQGHAVGEAFGYYFDEEGNVVYKVQTIGIQLEHLKGAKHLLAVAGGASKAKAIQAYCKQAPSATILITDEAAARNMFVK
ncbi:sugar-binding transcriptional regulator [Bacillus fonticola]|uniref:sugar-binding transcriptional regulator n=1 Tax=Bacillus fonticola TaxID=2728853 RepID=UPI001475597B|nr:sugar-binding domain-containing protein [Bacillus fonticola]